MAGRCPGHEEVCDIYAGDEQETSDCSEEHDQCQPQIIIGHPLARRSHRYPDAFQLFRKGFGKPVRDEYLPEFHKVRDEMLQRIEERRVEMQETQVAEAPREEPADSTAHMEPLDREKRGVFSRLFDLLF